MLSGGSVGGAPTDVGDAGDGRGAEAGGEDDAEEGRDGLEEFGDGRQEPLELKGGGRRGRGGVGGQPSKDGEAQRAAAWTAA